MRTFLATRQRTMNAVYVDGDLSLHNHEWSEYIPYTNVLWIRYLLFYLERDFKRYAAKEETQAFAKEIRAFKRGLNPRTLALNGGFEDARDVLEFCVDAGWVEEVQLK